MTYNLIQFIAEQTKLKNTTIVESFCLNHHDLVISENYERLLIPSFRSDKPIDILKIILLCAYYKKKYGSKIVLVSNKKFKNNFMFELFKQNYVDHIFYIKKYFDLVDIAKKFKITKVIYSESILPNDINKYVDHLGIVITPNDLLDGDDFYECTTTKKSKNVLVYTIDNNKDLKHNINYLLRSFYYETHEENIYNYIVPFLGMKIKTTLNIYNNSIFDYSISKQHGLISML